MSNSVRISTVYLAVAILATGALSAIDKNGVAPQAISLPAGPGSIQGLGESFQPQLNTGSGSTGVKLALPRGPGGITPDLSLVYNSGAGNGSLGLGWSLSGMLSVRRSTDRGVPYYVDQDDGADNDGDGRVDNPEELDSFTGANGEELVTLPDGTFRAENESAFLRYTRSGAGWEARARNGVRYLFGLSAQARIEDEGRVFEWCLEQVIDPNGNTIDYRYLADPASPAQKHLRLVRWGNAQAYLALVLGYEAGRPDVVTSYRTGFELETSLRLGGIDVVSHGIPAPAAALRADLDGAPGAEALVRRYRLEYQPDVHLSLLARLTQLGFDGVTALPTLTYSYTPWTPPDNVAAAVIRSRGAPAAGFESPSVELIDMNGDGLPDLLSTAGNQHRVFLNQGVGAAGFLEWAPGQPVGDAPTIDISSEKTHLADATADGLSDLMVKVSNTTFLCFDNTSQNAWVRAPLPITNTDTWPIWPYDGAGGALSRSFDSDYSRSNDILHTAQNGYQLWLLLPSGQYAREMRFPPLTVDGQVFRFDLLGAHIADLNGDRLQDLAWIQPSRVVYFPNRGRGSFAPPVILALGRSLTTAEIERSDFSDVDGDGLVDVTVVRPAAQPNGVLYWLNRFQDGLDGPRTVMGLPAQRAGDALRWADMNGNGTTDIVISQAQSAPGEKILFVDLVPEGKTHLLRQADNGLGRRISMDYESSTAQMVRARTAGATWATSMPMATTVVGRIGEDDGLSPPFEQTIEYRDPHWDPVRQEFRGFAGAEAREAGDESAASKRARYTFDTGRDEACLKGKQLSEEILGDDGKLFLRTATTWDTRVLSSGIDGRLVCFAFNRATDRFVHEGESEGVHLREEMDYDDFGNAVAERRLGVFEVSGDEILTERAYDLRLADWRLDLLVRETTRDGAGRRVAERRSTYDDRGNLERAEEWLEDGNRFVPSLRQRFDAFGNVIEKTDARGSRRSIAYDALLSSWPTAETIHLGDRDLVLTADYDLGLGTVTSSVSFAGERTDFVYDPLGRLIERHEAGGALETYEYEPGAPISRVSKHGREDGTAGTLDSHVYYDGQGRALLTKLEAEDGRWRVVAAKAYNSRKLEAHSWMSYLSATPDFEVPDSALAHNATFYDALGRAIETLAPDGSRTRTIYGPLQTRKLDGEDIATGGSPNVLSADGLERLVAVEERNGAEIYRTAYTWNARGELESIVDALQNVKRFRFDTLSRLVEIDDPDRGLLRMAYDDVGNLVRRTDARGQVVELTYDPANRLLAKTHRGAGDGGADRVESLRHYDVPAGELDFGDGSRGSARHTAGRLAWAEDRTGETHFSYDERGNVEWVLKRVRDPATGLLVSFRTQRQYDLLDREVAIVFPDNDLLRFDHGQGSFVTSIRGDGAQAATILADADYTANGRPLRLLWGNGVESRFEYDASQRLERERLIAAGGAVLRDEELAYDMDSNLTAIDDLRPTSSVPAASSRRTTARFAFDELHRLMRASYGESGNAGLVEYGHDALGNLVQQDTPPAGQPGHLADPSVDLGAIGYQGGRNGRQGRRPGDAPGPHAITSTANGHRLEYDANGNVTRYDATQLTWDFEDRLERCSSPDAMADYRYDHNGRRVIRSVVRGQAREETWSIDPACEVRGDGTLVKYAFLEGRRVARIQGSLDPTRESVQTQRLTSGWNLVSAAVETSVRLRDAFGTDAAVYQATGASSYAPLDLASPLPFGKALWVHVPSARVAAWRGPQRAIAAGATSTAPLHAWPRLEAFRPALHLAEDVGLLVFDGAARRWLRRDLSLPAFLSDAPVELGAARGFWSAAPVRFKAAPATTASLVFYHTDCVGSIAAMTDAGGALIEERAHYPFGAVRSVHRPGARIGGTDFDFSGHERDGESGLVHMGARSYLDLAGVFLSPDPRFTAVAALGGGSEEDRKSFASFLANPQMGNLYGHALRQPFKYIDPTGLEVTFSKGLSADPTFKHAWRAFVATPKGREILELVEDVGGRVYMKSGNVTSKYFGWPSSSRSYNAEAKMGTVTLNAAGFGASAGKDGITSADAINNLARQIHMQLTAIHHQHMVQDYQQMANDTFNKIIELGDKDPAQSKRLSDKLTIIKDAIQEHRDLADNPWKDEDVAAFESELDAPAKR